MCRRSGKREVECPNKALHDQYKELAKVEVDAFAWVQSFTEVEQSSCDVVVPYKAIIEKRSVMARPVTHLANS